jgi:hypothetical protein
MKQRARPSFDDQVVEQDAATAERARSVPVAYAKSTNLRLHYLISAVSPLLETKELTTLVVNRLETTRPPSRRNVGLIVRRVTTSEYLLLYVFDFLCAAVSCFEGVQRRDHLAIIKAVF